MLFYERSPAKVSYLCLCKCLKTLSGEESGIVIIFGWCKSTGDSDKSYKKK